MSQTRLKEYLMAKKVLFIGLDPSVVDCERWSHLNPEKLVAALRADESRQNELGYDAGIYFINHGETAQKTVRGYLDGDGFECPSWVPVSAPTPRNSSSLKR